MPVIYLCGLCPERSEPQDIARLPMGWSARIVEREEVVSGKGKKAITRKVSKLVETCVACSKKHQDEYEQRMVERREKWERDRKEREASSRNGVGNEVDAAPRPRPGSGKQVGGGARKRGPARG